MPYMFQKGEAWQSLEWYLSFNDDDGRPDRKWALLQDLRNNPRFLRPDGKHPHPAKAAGFSANDMQDMQDHLDKDWFGELDAAGQDVAHVHNGGPPFDGTGNTRPHRGWWLNWYGDAAGIFSEALQRAIEVSLGLGSGDDPKTLSDDSVDTKALNRDWPIEFVWICPVGWFQAGVSWRQIKIKQPLLARIGSALSSGKPDREGLVTVTWLTPGNSPAHDAPATASVGLHRDLGPQQNISGQARRGHWIVGHRFTTMVAPSGVSSGQVGIWGGVLPGNTSLKPDVMTVQPAANDGGVDPTWDY